ncbi:MAG: hypothetical protein ABIR30_12090 [Chitinophagaceae bacterium]
MKKIYWNNRLIAVAFMTIFTTLSAGSLQANDKDSLVPVELKQIGSIQNQPLFQLSFYGNAAQNDFIIRITDEYGNAIYRENIKAESFSKKFLLNTDEIGDAVIRFEISCRKSNQNVAYEIKRRTSYQQDLVINELR